MKHFVSILAKDTLTDNFSNTHTKDDDLFLGRRVDEDSKHSGTLISCADTAIISSSISRISPLNLSILKHTMCIYPKYSDTRHQRRRCWWCYNKKIIGSVILCSLTFHIDCMPL